MQTGSYANVKTIAKKVMYRPLLIAARIPVLQELIFATYDRAKILVEWMKTHPFDRQFGTHTSGYLPRKLIKPGFSSSRDVHFYIGCHPTCIRAALNTLPDPSGYGFLDLGCGKGRAMIVASEFPFRQIEGVDLSAQLVKVANRNAKVLRAAYPQRTHIEAKIGDAVEVELPEGNLVVFNYHAFGHELLGQIVDRLGEIVAGSGREIFFIYENPVHHDVLDGHPRFTRWFAGNVACEPQERGFAAEDEDNVVIWRAGGPSRQADPNANASIIITKPGWRAEVVPR